MALWTSNLLVLAQSVKPGTEQATESGLISPWFMGAIVVLMVLFPFGAGTLISKWLKMKELGMKIGVVLLTLELGLAPFVSQYVIGAAEKRNYDKQYDAWKAKQEYRDKISDKAVEELKSAVPGLEVLRDEKTKESSP